MKEQIRPIYNELQGYLSQAPDIDKGIIFDNMMWNQHNETVDELNQVSTKNYSKFKIEPKVKNWNGQMMAMVDVQEYRTKLGGLISRLHGEYFSDEQPPFSGMPSTVIHASQTQVQNQEQQQSMVIDIAMLLAEQRANYKEGTPERTFLDKCGEMLKKAKDIKEILSDIMNIATATGVGLEFLKKIFGL